MPLDVILNLREVADPGIPWNHVCAERCLGNAGDYDGFGAQFGVPVLSYRANCERGLGLRHAAEVTPTITPTLEFYKEHGDGWNKRYPFLVGHPPGGKKGPIFVERPNTDRMTLRSILVIQAKYIGDVILTSAAIRNLRLAYPDATITMICRPGLRAFVTGQNIADEAIGFDSRGNGRPLLTRLRDYVRLVSYLRRRKFDLTIDLSDTKSSRILHRAIGAPLRVGYEPPEKPLKFWEGQPANVFAATYGHGGPHYLYRYLSALVAIGVDTKDVNPRLEPTLDAQNESAGLLAQRGLTKGAYVVVHAGARFEGRCWQPERFAAVIDEIYAATGLRCLLVGGPEETVAEHKIMELATSPVVSVVGKASLQTLAALLFDASIFLGNESGPMHLAASVGTPVVALYGLTPPDIWAPLGVPHRILAPRLPCQCVAPQLCEPNNPGGVYCVHRLGVGEVTDAALDLIASERQALTTKRDRQAVGTVENSSIG